MEAPSGLFQRDLLDLHQHQLQKKKHLGELEAKHYLRGRTFSMKMNHHSLLCEAS